LANLIGALIFGDLFTHKKDCFITPHFFGHGIAQGFANRQRDGIGVGIIFFRFRCRLLRRFRFWLGFRRFGFLILIVIVRGRGL
jgi:hypothetical protein